MTKFQQKHFWFGFADFRKRGSSAGHHRGDSAITRRRGHVCRLQRQSDERGHQRGWLRRHRSLLLRLHRCRQPDGRPNHLHRPFEHDEGHTQVRIQPSRADVHWIRDRHEYPIHLLRVFFRTQKFPNYLRFESQVFPVFKYILTYLFWCTMHIFIFSIFVVKQDFPNPIQQNSCQLLNHKCTILWDGTICVVFTIHGASFAKIM